MIKRLRSNDRGFTLIELLIVVIILAILAAIVVFAVGGFRTTSVRNACKSDYRSLQTAMEAQKADTGAYPSAVSDGNFSSSTYMKNPPPNGPDYHFHTDGSGGITVYSKVHASGGSEGTNLGSSQSACGSLA